MKKVLTEEEKASKKLANVISDMRLDAELIGEALGVSQPVQVLNRFVEMVDGMYLSRERFRKALGEEPSEIPDMPKFEVEEKTEDNVSVTSFINRCNILSELWINYKMDEEYVELFTHSDLGYPMAYIISEGIMAPTEESKFFIDETWDLFLAGEGVQDNVFETLADVFAYASEN